VSIVKNWTPMASHSHIRNQRKNQNARQAAIISGLSTIYRNQSTTHAIQTHQQTEPRIFLLDITLEDMNRMYHKIHGIIEKGRIRPKGSEVYFVTRKMEHLIWSDDAVYEIQHNSLIERIPIDGQVSTVEISREYSNGSSIPLVVDESYYKFNSSLPFIGTHISPNHIITRHMKIVVKLHPKSLNSFVYIMNETETRVLDFYITTENGIIEARQQRGDGDGGGHGDGDIITKQCKDDIISFIDHFKLCS
jgi:hypothetical protein